MENKFERLSQNKAADFLGIKPETLKKISEIENWDVTKEKNIRLYLKSDLMKYIENNPINKNNRHLFVSQSQAVKILNVGMVTFKILADKKKWNVIAQGQTLYYLKSDIQGYKEKFLFELDNDYLTVNQVEDILGKNRKNVFRLAKDKGWKFITVGKESKKYFLKYDVLTYKTESEKDIYYTKQEAKKILGMGDIKFDRISKEEGWEIVLKNKLSILYLKSDILKYKEEKQKYDMEIKKNYLNLIESAEYLNMASATFYSLVKEYNIPSKSGEARRILFEKSELDKYISLKEQWITDKVTRIEAANIFGSVSTLSMICDKFNIKTVKKPRYVYTKEYPLNCVFYDKNEILMAKEKYDNGILEDEDINDFLNIEQFIPLQEVENILNVTYRKIEQILKKNYFPFEVRRIKGKRYINKEFVDRLVIEQKKFKENYYIYTEIRELIPRDEIDKFEHIKIPEYVCTKDISVSIANKKYAYKKSDIDKYINNKREKEYDLTDYMSRKEVMEQLGLIESKMIEFINEYKPKCLKVGRLKYYLKDDINFFKEQQLHLGPRYMTVSMVKEVYGFDPHKKFKGNIPNYKIPSFCSNKNLYTTAQVYYDKVEIDAALNKMNYNNIIGQNDYHTFELKLNMKEEYNNFKGSKYTKRRWFEFVEERLLKVEGFGYKYRNDVINCLIRCTLQLEDLLRRNNVSEVYKLTTKRINLWFKSIPNLTNRMHLYFFIESIDNDLKLKLQKTSEINKNFNFSKVYRYDNKKIFKGADSEEFENTIYKYEEFIGVFKHLINIDIHVKNSIEYMEKNNNSIGYISTWLYTLLHLNNGWRHGDVTKFPRLYFKDMLDELRINDIRWFENNKISLSDSRKVISRIIQYDFRISKTGVYGSFFCSDTLAPPIATAILMIELYYNYIFIGKVPEFDKPLMKFDSKHNEPTEKQIKLCFNECKISNFSFSSRKMNRSVLTFIYNIANQVCPSGYNILLLPKTLRKHIEDMSTVQYIEFDSDALEFLSGELFERGEFGYITDALLNLIGKKPDKSIERTEDIKKVNTIFGDAQKVEATIRLLNYYEDERKEIVEMLLNDKDNIDQKIEFCTKTLSQIYMSCLPSRQEHVQCLFSNEGCKYPDRDIEKIPCSVCKYGIPSIYAMKTLCNMLMEEICLFMEAKNIGRKIKLSSSIHNKMSVILVAINKFGKEYIYNCLDIDREKFIEIINTIPTVDRLMELI